MDTSRTVINIIDNSTTYEQETTQITGFTVVRAPKGPCTPVKIYKNGAASLKDIFGVSSKEYPELFEAETFNREYDLYVSAPYSAETKIPVAYLTNQGIVLGGDTIVYNSDIEAYALGEIDEIADAANVFLPTNPPKYLRDTRYPEKYGLPGHSVKENLIPQVASINLGGESDEDGLLIYTGIKYVDFGRVPAEIKLINGNYSVNYTVDGTDIKKGDTKVGTYLVKKTVSDTTKWVAPSEDDALEVSIFIYGDTDLSLTDPTAVEAIESYWVDTLSSNDVYAVIFPKFPSERKLHISFSEFSKLANYDGTIATNWNKLKMRVYEEGAFRDSSNSIYVEGSLNNKDTASDGSYIGFSSMNASYSNQNLVCVYKFKEFQLGDSVEAISGFGTIELSGGVRVLNDDIYDKGWEKAHESEYSDVDIFFDSTTHDRGLTSYKDTNSTFLGLATDDVATSTHGLARYVFNDVLTPTILDIAPDITQYRLVHGKNYWNICNVGIIEDRIHGTKFSAALTGAYSLMLARILEYKHGGAAPMWENTSISGVGIGGQLNMISVYKLKYKYTKKQLDTLDALNYNPVINDRQYGIMIVGQKTCKDGDTTDWSYIGHTSAFLDFLKQVRNNVMIPQIGKPNNPYYRTLRKDQVDAYLAQRLNGSDRIWAWAECDTSTADGINDVYARKARKFVIKVRVQVDVFSEKVELNFTNEGQDSIVSVQ